jgi:hypothetical protein
VDIGGTGFTKAGGGTLVLTGTETFGAVGLNAGVLTYTCGPAMPTTLTTGGNATLRVQGGVTCTFSGITVSTGNTLTLTTGGGSDLTVGNLTANGSMTGGGVGLTLTVTGTLSGSVLC